MSSLQGVFSASVSNEAFTKNRAVGSFNGYSSIGTLQFKESKSNEFLGKTLDLSDQRSIANLKIKAPNNDPVYAQSSVRISKSLRWWEKFLHPNMVEIQSAQELVDSLLAAGDRLVIVDFYSPGVGGCKALHPKICQLAESNPDSMFLKVNFEEHKSMCHALHVHVLPFFRFYRGAEGRVCSFSCTNATIKKFRDALAKHGTDRCSLDPTKGGLNESELLALSSIGQISRDYVHNSSENDNVENLIPKETIPMPHAFSKDEAKMGFKEGNAVLMA